MKFRLSKNFISLIVLFTVLLVLFSACGTQSINTNIKSVNQPVKDTFEKYSPPIDMSFVRGIDDDLAVNVMPMCPGETLENNRWNKRYLEKLGINIKYSWTVRGNEYSDAFNRKMNVTLASDDLPDMTFVNPVQLRQLVDADMVEDMTQYYNKYAGKLFKKYLTAESQANIDSVTIDGKMMAIREPSSFCESAQYIWIRNDWLKRLGLNPPKTMDDLLKISEAFTQNDPDGNGKNDTYGLPITKDIYGECMGTEGFFAAYHAYPNMWILDKTGKLVYGSVQPEVKIALQKLANMYKTGQIDNDFGIKGSDKVAEMITAGKFGIDFGQQWNPMYPLINNYNNDHNADWTGYSLVSADEKKVMVPLKLNVPRIWAIKKGYKHPEALIKMFNLYYDTISGSEYNKYSMPRENGNVGVWKFSPIWHSSPLNNINMFRALQLARKTKDFSKLPEDGINIQKNVEAYLAGDKSQWGWEKIYGSNGVYVHMEQYIMNKQLYYDKFNSSPTKTMVEKQAALQKMEKEEFIKIIMGAAPISEFEKFVNDWNSLGGADMTKEANESYHKNKSK